MIPLAVFGSVFIGIILLIFVNKKSHTNPYILVLQCENSESETSAMGYLSGVIDHLTVKSKSVRAGLVELNLEIRLKKDDTSFINDLSEMPGVQSAVLVSYNGDYMG